jgi:hypothetical protein
VAIFLQLIPFTLLKLFNRAFMASIYTQTPPQIIVCMCALCCYRIDDGKSRLNAKEREEKKNTQHTLKVVVRK